MSEQRTARYNVRRNPGKPEYIRRGVANMHRTLCSPPARVYIPLTVISVRHFDRGFRKFVQRFRGRTDGAGSGINSSWFFKAFFFLFPLLLSVRRNSCRRMLEIDRIILSVHGESIFFYVFFFVRDISLSLRIDICRSVLVLSASVLQSMRCRFCSRNYFFISFFLETQPRGL